ncbi:hypothetical protein FEV09_14915 [Pseudanabaena catenata USMAC16]|uniref:Uncharacterized protein n=1 Tax=Pseudanabaena catenata USMAC16 TaxID=1855837 RepID=A0A9X4RJC0_9CYAN|nr:hypothetical protein [Pseudanabaena catenata]MDG3495840.1 hypothetical protein [Pseudanabaena catenata USMAC16]
MGKRSPSSWVDSDLLATCPQELAPKNLPPKNLPPKNLPPKKKRTARSAVLFFLGFVSCHLI